MKKNTAGFNGSMQRFHSSAIAAAGYDYETKVLRVELVSGLAYDYEGVDQDTWHNLMTAESAGRYFNSAVKGRYPERRVA